MIADAALIQVNSIYRARYEFRGRLNLGRLANVSPSWQYGTSQTVVMASDSSAEKEPIYTSSRKTCACTWVVKTLIRLLENGRK